MLYQSIPFGPISRSPNGDKKEISKSRFSASSLGLGADMFLPNAGPSSQPLSHSFGPQFSLESGELSLERGLPSHKDLSSHEDLSPMFEGLHRVGSEENVGPVDLSVSGQLWQHMDHYMLLCVSRFL